MDISKVLEPAQLNVLQRLIEQNDQKFTAANGETVRFPYSQRKIESARISKAYVFFDSAQRAWRMLLCH